MSLTYLRNIAIVGAAGNSGSYMTAEFLKTGKHTVTAISRIDSKSTFPEGVKVARVDYSSSESLISALRGQDALVITLSVFAHDQQKALIEAASEAGVEWILPNEWGFDTGNPDVVKDIAPAKHNVDARKLITDLGKSAFISVVTGFWYEWSMAIPCAYGIDLNKKEAVFFDEGKTKISTSTWPQVGRAVAALLSLPINAEEGANSCLEDFRNQLVYVNSFTISQEEMLSSVLRVTGSDESEWHITREPCYERYAAGLREMNEGNRLGFAKMMYTRNFFPDGSGDFESSKGVLNQVLCLPKEDIDTATRAAIERAKTWSW